MLQVEISRRYVLKLLAGTTISDLILSELGWPAETSTTVAPADTAAAPAYVAKFFNAHQMRTLVAAAEIIIPADEHSPGAKAAKVEEYMDEIIADATTEQKDRDLWTQGLQALDTLSKRKFQKEFLGLTQMQMQSLLTEMARNEDHPESLEERFFVALKAATVDGYYNSAIGIHLDICYQGNRAQRHFIGCRHEGHEKLVIAK